MAQRMLSRAKLIDEFVNIGAEDFRLLLSVADFEPSDGELGLRIMKIIGRELANAAQSQVSGQRKSVLTENFHHFVGESHTELLADVDERNRVEVFLHLNMTIGVDLRRAPLTHLEPRAR